MKKLFENWRKYLKENEEVSDVQKQVIQIVSDNQFLSHLASQIDGDTVKDVGSMYYLQFPNQFASDHMQKHFDKSSKASIWSVPPDKVSELMLQVMQQSPTKSVTERGTLKHKWLNVDAGENIGFDSLKKLDSNDSSISMEDDLERFGMTDRVKDWNVVSKVAQDNDYELVTQDGRPYTEQDLANGEPSFIKQILGVIPGRKEDNPTRLMNVIVAQIGEVNGKPVVSLMSTYPGHQPVDQNGNDLTNKKDFKDHGYYFIKGQ